MPLTINISMTDYKIFVNVMREFLILCVEELDLKDLPKIKWLITGNITGNQPSFGRFDSKTQTVNIEIKNRHPLDIMRTTAHELVHYKQFLDGKINSESGKTGSDIENQAHAIAGIIMRHFNKSHPEIFKSEPIT